MKFEIVNNKFVKDGKEIKIISGAVHYFRNMPDTWDDIFCKLKAMGCNTVETYCAWNMHEKKMDEFDFSGPISRRTPSAGIPVKVKSVIAGNRIGAQQTAYHTYGCDHYRFYDFHFSLLVLVIYHSTGVNSNQQVEPASASTVISVTP